MTPAARAQAAIEILDAYLDGVVLEKALLSWSRGSRYAGSKDRAAVRDIVYDAVRKRRSCGAWPKGSARLWVARVLQQSAADPASLYGDGPYAPAPLTEAEAAALSTSFSAAPNVPDWVAAEVTQALGPKAEDLLAAYDHRAPVFLRVNRHNTSVAQAQASLARDGIVTQSMDDQPKALDSLPYGLVVTDGARRVAGSQAFQDGWVEVQDASSQRAAEAVPATGSVLDYCAGGGGKALAIADRGGQVTAHDISPARLANISDRVERAGVSINIATPGTLTQHSQFDAVLCDVPCSGSGAWRRNPDAKWTLTAADLSDYVSLQRDIIDKALAYCKPGGTFAYVTCSVFDAENAEQASWIETTHAGLSLVTQSASFPQPAAICGDGFYFAVFRHG